MDRHTLFSMQAGLLVFLGLVIAVTHHIRRRPISDTSPYWFAAAYISGGIGLGLQAYRGLISPVIAIMVGNTLFFFLSVFLTKAVAVATKQKSFMWHFIVLTAIIIASFGYFTFIKPNLMLRVIEAVLAGTVMHGIIAAQLLRNKDKVIHLATRSMAYLLIAHISFSLLGVFGGVIVNKIGIWFSWMGLVSIAGIALSFLWIDNLRISAELETQAMTDPLTGLLNRRALDMFALREIDLAVRNHWPCSALMMDVNNFKEINDRYGHSAGDAALVAVANVLNTTLRASDLITRVGGDEFFVLLPNSDESTTTLIVSRIRLAIRALSLESPGNENFGIRLSIGQTTQRGKNMTLAELLHAADIMLYNEKHARKTKALEQSEPQRTSGAHVHPSN